MISGRHCPLTSNRSGRKPRAAITKREAFPNETVGLAALDGSKYDLGTVAGDEPDEAGDRQQGDERGDERQGHPVILTIFTAIGDSTKCIVPRIAYRIL